MGRDRRAGERAMELDLEQAPQFRRDMQMFALVVQPDIPVRRTLAEWMLCQRLGVLKRGNPTGNPNAFR
jgi:hypothetical protein